MPMVVYESTIWEPSYICSVELILLTLLLSALKGKPSERWGRKATGLRGNPMIAELQRIAGPIQAAIGFFLYPHSIPVKTLDMRHREGGCRGF
jgi:hypothetical protein